MERLTYWNGISKLNAFLKKGLDAIWSKKLKKYRYEIITNAIDRLALYEDIGLEPEEIPQWISITEKLPKHGGTHIICTKHGDVFTAEYWIERKEFTRLDGSNFVSQVMYWQSLPNAPKGEKPC